MTKKIKELLISFGYRKVEEGLYLKPYGLMLISAKIESNTIVLKSLFKNNPTHNIEVWGTREIKVDESVDANVLKMDFGYAEMGLFVNGIGGDTFNWLTPAEQLMIEEGVI